MPSEVNRDDLRAVADDIKAYVAERVTLSDQITAKGFDRISSDVGELRRLTGEHAVTLGVHGQRLYALEQRSRVPGAVASSADGEPVEASKSGRRLAYIIGGLIVGAIESVRLFWTK